MVLWVGSKLYLLIDYSVTRFYGLEINYIYFMGRYYGLGVNFNYSMVTP